METIDSLIISTGILLKAAGSLFFKFVMKFRLPILASGLLYTTAVLFGHAVDHPQNSPWFTWGAVVTGIAAVILVVHIIESAAPARFHEFDHVDHKEVPGTDWFTERELSR